MRRISASACILIEVGADVFQIDLLLADIVKPDLRPIIVRIIVHVDEDAAAVGHPPSLHETVPRIQKNRLARIGTGDRPECKEGPGMSSASTRPVGNGLLTGPIAVAIARVITTGRTKLEFIQNPTSIRSKSAFGIAVKVGKFHLRSSIPCPGRIPLALAEQ